MQPDRATALLAVVRIVCVLGMSFGIAFGIFLLLGGWWLTGLISLAAALPFFALMRFMEKKHWEAEQAGSNE
jgi:hypothetical protein